MYLLDTNACIRILRGSSTALVEHLGQHAPQEICLCSMVKAELIYGAYRSARPAENIRLLARFFEPFESFPLMIAALTLTGAFEAIWKEQK